MDVICAAHRIIQRGRSIPPELAARLDFIGAGAMVTEPRADVLELMRWFTCNKMLRSPAELFELDTPIIAPGNLTSRILVWYMAEWSARELFTYIKVIAANVGVRNHRLLPRTCSMIDAIFTAIYHPQDDPFIWDKPPTFINPVPLVQFIQSIVKLDSDGANVFSYREEPRMDIVGRDELFAGLSIALEYMIYSVAGPAKKSKFETGKTVMEEFELAHRIYCKIARAFVSA